MSAVPLWSANLPPPLIEVWQNPSVYKARHWEGGGESLWSRLAFHTTTKRHIYLLHQLQHIFLFFIFRREYSLLNKKYTSGDLLAALRMLCPVILTVVLPGRFYHLPSPMRKVTPRDVSWLILGHTTDKGSAAKWCQVSPALKPVPFNSTTHLPKCEPLKGQILARWLRVGCEVIKRDGCELLEQCSSLRESSDPA